MKKNKLKLDVVSQQKRLLTENVDSVSVETTEGEITILPNHTPLLTRLKEGVLKYKIDDVPDFVAIFGGFIEVSPDGDVNVLADSATRAESIDIAKVENAKKEAEEALKDKESDKEFALIEATLRRAALELKVAKKYASSTKTPKV